ncbi:MAG: hypothetical protein QM652_13145 [Legionella sp.]|uniref:hypothetical protein n=1 Tax=Legionella sp. TaxID=459 RepID=UPI0039E686C7
MSTNWVGPFYIPGKSACYFCAVKQEKLELILKKTPKNQRVDKRAFCPILSISCSIAVLEAAVYLSGIDEPQTVLGMSAINPFNLSKSSFLTIEKSKNCFYCNSEQHIKSL